MVSIRQEARGNCAMKDSIRITLSKDESLLIFSCLDLLIHNSVNSNDKNKAWNICRKIGEHVI
jgi:hypothetical protein